MDDFKNDLRRMEKRRSDIYDDATGETIRYGTVIKGNPTTGIGRALNKKPLKNDEIEYLLNNDANDCYSFCDAAFPWFRVMDDMQKRGIMNMVFQLGPTGFTEFHKMIAYLSTEDYTNAYAAGIDSDWARKFPARAAAVLNMVCYGTV